MKCEKCGTNLPEGVTECPTCKAQQAAPLETGAYTNGSAVRSQTVPQRPRTAYAERRSERKGESEEPGKKRKGKAHIIILVLVITALLCAAFFIGYRILQNGKEEPDLGDPKSGISGNENPDDGTLPNDGEDGEDGDTGAGEDEPAVPVTYDLAGVWVWDSDLSLMKETVWQFSADGSLKIYYFGLGGAENPFTEWPENYTYEKDTATLTLAGEKIELSWRNETAFTMNSKALGICDAKKTDEAHIPSGAVDIREAESNDTEDADTGTNETNGENTTPTAYFFADSDNRYLKKSECEKLTADELRIARNEIYARHGRLFESEDLQSYFDAQDWYQGTIKPEKFDYNSLNDFERYNVNLMKSVETAKK